MRVCRFEAIYLGLSIVRPDTCANAECQIQRASHLSISSPSKNMALKDPQARYIQLPTISKRIKFYIMNHDDHYCYNKL